MAMVRSKHQQHSSSDVYWPPLLVIPHRYHQRCRVRPPARCPVCGNTSITAVEHAETYKMPSKQIPTYRCSNHHTFYGVPREVARAQRLRNEARSGRRKADEHINRARNLRGERGHKAVDLIQGFERLDTDQALEMARETVRRSRETRAKAQRTWAATQELTERAKERIDDAKRARERLLRDSPAS